MGAYFAGHRSILAYRTMTKDDLKGFSTYLSGLKVTFCVSSATAISTIMTEASIELSGLA